MGDEFGDKRFRKILGQKIKELRQIKGLTQIELAEKLGFTSTGAISQVENGLRGLKVESIMKVADYFNVHPIVLMTPYILKNDEIEIVSDLFKLFKKCRRKPDQMRHCMVSIRKLLHRIVRDLR